MTRLEEALHPAVITLIGLGCIIILAGFWHVVGFADEPSQEGYFLTSFFLRCVSWPFMAVYALLGVGMGLITAGERFVALGMMLPLPMSLLVEVVLDSTSHNLLPFEIILYWLPAFGVAWLGAYGGRRLRERFGGQLV